MRAVIHLHDFDPDCIDPEDYDPDGPPADERAVIPEIETEWYHGGGNIHVVDPDVEQIADTVAGHVIIDHPAFAPDVHEIRNATLATVYNE